MASIDYALPDSGDGGLIQINLLKGGRGGQDRQAQEEGNSDPSTEASGLCY